MSDCERCGELSEQYHRELETSSRLLAECEQLKDELKRILVALSAMTTRAIEVRLGG